MKHTVSVNPGSASRDKKVIVNLKSTWKAADLIAGDMHNIRKNYPEDLSGKFVITHTTTEDDIELLGKRGVGTALTTTPRCEGRL